MDSFTAEVRVLELGFRTDSGATMPVPAEALIVTGDLNIVDVQLLVQYHIKDLDAFVSYVADPEECPDRSTLRDAAQAASSQVVGQRSGDDIITIKKEEVQADIQLLLQQILDQYRTGIQVLAVHLQDVSPPEEVRSAYEDVVRAAMDRERIINEARAYEQDQIPRSMGKAQMILLAAGVFKAERIVNAAREADRFVSILDAYDKEENEALKRLHLEALESILPGITEFIEAVESTAISSPGIRPPGHFLSGRRFASVPMLEIVLARYSEGASVIGDPRMPARLPSLSSDTTLDNRLLRIDLPVASMLDKDKQFLELDAYVRYRIVDPDRFTQTLKDELAASSRIGNIVMVELRAELAQITQAEIIGGDPIVLDDGTVIVQPRVTEDGVPTREALMQRVLESSNQTVGSEGNDFGIEIVDVRLKRVSFPAAVEESVFARMRAERARQANRLRAEGEEASTTIRRDVDRRVTIILAEAELAANILRGEGETEAIARIHRCGAALGLEQGVRAVGRDGPRSIPINGAGGGLWLELVAPMAVLGSGAGAGSAGQHAREDNRGPGRCDSVGWLSSLVDVSGAVGAVRQAMAGLANRARARVNWVSQGQPCGRCKVRRRAERVSRPAREKKRRRRVLVVTTPSPRPMRAVQRARLWAST